MKLDPDIHIVMHLAFFGKTGVTLRGLIIHQHANQKCSGAQFDFLQVFVQRGMTPSISGKFLHDGLTLLGD
jgi:hypothetical protein